jgi:AcrR family transcriptional regulator
MLSTVIYNLVDKRGLRHTAYMPKVAKPQPRRRLDAETARQLILDAAEKRMVVVGPSGIRLQEVAADAGVSHPTVLHHFGSREQLVKAVITRSVEHINATLVAAIQGAKGDGDVLAETLIENVHQAFERTGHARVLLWLALEGHSIDGAKVKLTDIVDAAHTLRLTNNKRAERPTRDDTANTIVLSALGIIAGSLLGSTLLANAGMPSDARGNAAFRKWFARLLLAHLDA